MKVPHLFHSIPPAVQWRHAVYLVLLAGFFLGVALLIHAPELRIRGDENAYTDLAQLIVQNPLGYQNVLRPPAYPYFLAFLFVLFGEDTAATLRFPVGIVQALLATVNLAASYALTLTLFRRRGVALVATSAFAVYLELIALPRLYYAETLFSSLLDFGFSCVPRTSGQIIGAFLPAPYRCLSQVSYSPPQR